MFGNLTYWRDKASSAIFMGINVLPQNKCSTIFNTVHALIHRHMHLPGWTLVRVNHEIWEPFWRSINTRFPSRKSMFLKLHTLFHLKDLSDDRGNNCGRKKKERERTGMSTLIHMKIHTLFVVVEKQSKRLNKKNHCISCMILFVTERDTSNLPQAVHKSFKNVWS